MKRERVIVIDANQKYRFSQLTEMWLYKDLFFLWVKKDIKIHYGRTYLGFWWALLTPVLNMTILTVVFHKLAGIESAQIPYPLFCLIALLAWTYFSGSMNMATTNLIGNSKLLSKVYFPRLFIPLTPLVFKLVDFFIGFLFVIAFIIYYRIELTIQVVYFPLFFFMLIVFTMGASLLFSSLSIKYRDIKYAGGFIIQLLLFVSPIVFPASLVKEKVSYIAYVIYGFYPLVGVVEGFRATLTGIHPVPWDLLATGLVGSFSLFVVGLLYFQKTEKIFADL